MAFDRVPMRWILVLALLALLAPPATAVPTRVAGTKVSLDPPPGFIPSARFPGFENSANAASIIVTELPGPASDMQKGMTGEALASRGMTLIHSETVKIEGQPAILLQASQSAAGTGFVKWMLVAGDAKKTVMIVAAYPEAAKELAMALRATLLSASWSGAPRKVNPYEGLMFRVDPTPKLKLAGRVGALLVFSETGSMQPSNAADAMMVVGNSISDVKIDNVETFARVRASKTTRIGPLRNLQGRAVTADRLKGYELVGETNDLKSGQALRMYQLVVADDKNYYLAQGFVSPEHAAVMIPEFRKITGSFRRLHPPK